MTKDGPKKSNLETLGTLSFSKMDRKQKLF
jgi:hypothetical protein